MKSFVCLLVFAMLLALPALAMARSSSVCYWQLESVSVSCDAVSYLPATAEATMESFASDDLRTMMDALRGGCGFSLSLSREVNRSALGLTETRTATAEHTLDALPAIVPGGACARVNLTTRSASDPGSYYMYLTVDVNYRRLLRARNSGAWMVRVSFPRVAEAPAASRSA